MKKIITSMAVFAATLSYGQIGAVAPDFTVTDMNGNSHTLYSYLNAGKVVVLDVSATWCGPCWGFHSEHFLNEINAEYGAAGTNEVVVLFYEGDAATTEADMNGTGGSTQGDWVTGTTYPMVNESPLQLNLSVFAPLGFPTINVICPSDKKIKADLWDSWTQGNHTTSINAMKAVLDQNIDACALNNAGIQENSVLDLKLYPNPTKEKVTIHVKDNMSGETNVKVFGVNGSLIQDNNFNIVSGTETIEVNLNSLEVGSYFIQVSNGELTSKMIKVVKQ